MPAPDVTGFDLRALPEGFHDNPYRWYAALRAKGSHTTWVDHLLDRMAAKAGARPWT